MDYQLVPMDKSHLKEVAELDKTLFTRPWSADSWESELYNDTVSLVVAETEDGGVLGYGVDEDGDPKNLALLMKKFDHVLSQVDENGTVPEVLGGNQRVIDLLGKFDDVCDFTLKGYTNITTEAKFLTSNTETLESQTLNLNEQIVDLEQVDLADAITQFMWDYNCYNAALKIGTQLLSQSLLDYMS